MVGLKNEFSIPFLNAKKYPTFVGGSALTEVDMKYRSNEQQNIGILKEAESGMKADLCRKHGIKEATYTIIGKPNLAT